MSILPLQKKGKSDLALGVLRGKIINVREITLSLPVLKVLGRENTFFCKEILVIFCLVKKIKLAIAELEAIFDTLQWGF